MLNRATILGLILLASAQLLIAGSIVVHNDTKFKVDLNVHGNTLTVEPGQKETLDNIHP